MSTIKLRSANAHTHLYSGLAPLGMPAPAVAPTSFVEILEKVWWRLDRALDRQSLVMSARYYVAHARSHGCVALLDHHESPNFIEGSLDVLADACEEFGMYAVLCYGATERNGGREEAQRGLAECKRFIEANKRPDIRGVVALHACFTVSDETITEAADLARSLDTVLHLHVAEDLADVLDAKRRGYSGVVDRLDKLGALIPGSIFAHGVHLEAGEVKRLSEGKIWLVQNPRSNEGNGVGYPGHLGSSSLVALGTDGYPADMHAEAAALLRLAEGHGEDEQRLAARQLGSMSLLSELLGAIPGEFEMNADLEDLELEAQEEAKRLWQRMEELD